MGSLSAPGTLKILVIGAEGLDRVTSVGEQQPYYIIECGRQRSRSKPCLTSGTAPHWNTAHKFELLDETAAVAVIKDEGSKAVIAEGLIDLSRARLTGRDAATAQLRNLAGLPAGLLRFKLKFQAAEQQQQQQHGRLSDSGRAGSGLMDGSHGYMGSAADARGRLSEAGSYRRISEAGSYRSASGSVTDGRARSATPPGRLGSRSGRLSASGRQEEPDMVLASVTSKVSLAKQAMQQLTAELAELTGPGQSPSGQAGGSRPGSAQHSAFAAESAQQPWRRGGSALDSHSRSGSRQGSLGLNVLGQPVQQQQQQQQPSNSNAWHDYRQAYHQTRPHQQQQRRHSGNLDPAESWATAAGNELPMPHQHQHHQQRMPRISTGSLTPSGMLTPDMSPRAAAAYAAYAAAAAAGAAEGGLPPSWPRLRGVFGGEVLSTEELVALYASSGHSSEKKLITLLEEALAAAHAEKVATEQELSNVKEAMASMSKQHYMDVKRLREVTAAAGLAAPAGEASGRPLTPLRFRNPDGTPPASPRGGLYSMVDTKPTRSGRLSRASDSSDLMGARDPSPLRSGLTIATGRGGAAAAAPGMSPTAAVTAAAAAAAATGELASLRAQHSKLKAASAQLEQEVARLKQRAQQADSLEQQVQRLQEQAAAAADAGGGSSGKGLAAAGGAAVGAAAGGAVAAAVAAAELEALRNEHVRVRALAEGLEEEVEHLRQSQQQLEDTRQQLEDLQSQHAGVKEALATTQAQLEKARQGGSSSKSEWQDAASDFDGSGSSNGGSPMPAYKLQIQVHQLERQLAEAGAKSRDDEAKRQKLVTDMQGLQEQLEQQANAVRRAEENARAAEEKAANQATIAAAARAEAAEARSNTESTSGKEAQLSEELQSARHGLEAALADKAELETALGLLDRDSKEQLERLQAELTALREGSGDVASLQAQLAAAKEEASGRNDSEAGEEVEYLQAQLRRTLRQVVELQRQVQVLQQERPADQAGGEQDHEAALDAAIRSEHEFLMQELVAAKLELAEVKEQQLITQRQLFKAQESIKQGAGS